MKVIKYLEGRGFLVQKTTEQVINKKGWFHGPLIRADLPFLKNLLTSLAKSMLIPLGSTEAASPKDEMKKRYEKKDIRKIVKSPGESGALPKIASKTIENEAKEQNNRLLSILLVTLAASVLANKLADKEGIRAS